jgi:hypothetical protein
MLNSKVNANRVQRYIEYSEHVYVRLNESKVKATVSVTLYVLLNQSSLLLITHTSL